MRVRSEKPIARELREKVADIIEDAIRALEAGQSTALARSQLREVSRKLSELEFEYKGGCYW
jgi:hypothetical protein